MTTIPEKAPGHITCTLAKRIAKCALPGGLAGNGRRRILAYQLGQGMFRLLRKEECYAYAKVKQDAAEFTKYRAKQGKDDRGGKG